MAFVAAPDYENAADADRDNEYEVIVSASDGQGARKETILGAAV